MPLKQSPGKMQKLSKDDRFMFLTSVDDATIKQILSTHNPDGREIDVRPLLQIVEDIFNRATLDSAYGVPGSQALAEPSEDKTHQAKLEALVHVIDQIANEMACKCSVSGDANATTLSVLSSLSNYSWNAKLVIALAAFAMNYGEFWLVAQTYNSNQLAKSMAIIKQLPDVFEHLNSMSPRFEDFKSLIKVMLDITKCIVEFKGLPSQYISADTAALSTAMEEIPVAVYWTIKSMVACASQITGFTGMAHEQVVSTAEAWEIPTLAHKLSNMHSHLASQLIICNKCIDERKLMETYQNLLYLFKMAHTDNMKVLKALIYAKNDLDPLVNCATKWTVNIDVLKKKIVLLLISDLDISQEELMILERVYNEARQHPENWFELVWLPIMDPESPWTESREQRFDHLQTNMPWYTVKHPSLIERAVIKFIKEVWHFSKNPIVVVLDPQGQDVSTNALHMIRIWGREAFPFTNSREESLWEAESWRLELLLNGIDPLVSGINPVFLDWISLGRYIILYGGEDIEWIRKFTSTARYVAAAAGIPVEMVYVGKSNPKERMLKIIKTIISERLSHCWDDLTTIWNFWVRIHSMWQSKNKLGRTIDNDPIMREIMTLLSFDGSEGGWAIISRGSLEMIKAKGSTLLTCLLDYKNWKLQAEENGFLSALKERIMQVHTPHHCSRIKLPGIAGMIPDRVVCSECGRTMEKFILYQCCDD